MNLPGHRIVAWLGKAALKTHALQTLRDCRASPKRAKRLECVRFIGAFRRARDGPRFMVPMHSKNEKGLSMNLPGHRIGACLGKAALKMAEDARTPDASRLPGVSEPREASGVRPIYRRFPSSAATPRPNANRPKRRGAKNAEGRGEPQALRTSAFLRVSASLRLCVKEFAQFANTATECSAAKP